MTYAPFVNYSHNHLYQNYNVIKLKRKSLSDAALHTGHKQHQQIQLIILYHLNIYKT